MIRRYEDAMETENQKRSMMRSMFPVAPSRSATCMVDSVVGEIKREAPGKD